MSQASSHTSSKPLAMESTASSIKPTCNDPSEFVYIPGVDNVEEREDYTTDGFHPVLLGDTLDGGRYRIVHKLGFGAVGTVWLARDNREARYVSIKISMSWICENNRELYVQRHLRTKNSDHPGRQHISMLVDDFTLDGPNGRHLCLVYHALGPSITGLHSEYGGPFLKVRSDVTRELARQVGEAVDFMHGSGLICGDLSASNVLLELCAIHNMSEADIYEDFGTPEEDEVLLSSGEGPLPPSAPHVLYAPINWCKVPLRHLVPRIKLIDFGNTFLSSDPPSDSDVAFNNSYAAPELLQGERPTLASDIWALGCLIFEIRSGMQLISQGYFGTKGAALIDIERMLRIKSENTAEPIAPKKSLEQTEQSAGMYNGSGDMNSRHSEAVRAQKDSEWTDPAMPQATNSHSQGVNDSMKVRFLQGASDLCRSPAQWILHGLKQMVRPKAPQEALVELPVNDPINSFRGAWTQAEIKATDSSNRSLQERILGIGKPDAWHTMIGLQDRIFSDPISGEEAADLEDLLIGMLRYSPGERVTLDQISAHRWFSKKYASDVEGDWLQRCSGDVGDPPTFLWRGSTMYRLS